MMASPSHRASSAPRLRLAENPAPPPLDGGGGAPPLEHAWRALRGRGAVPDRGAGGGFTRRA